MESIELIDIITPNNYIRLNRLIIDVYRFIKLFTELIELIDLIEIKELIDSIKSSELKWTLMPSRLHIHGNY